MRYAQIIIGLKDSGKSTYCKLMAKYAESRGRKIRIVNLDPTPGDLAYDHPLADVRDIVKSDEVEKKEKAAPNTGAGFEYVLDQIVAESDWLYDSVRDVNEGDYVLFDCPGESEYFNHSKTMKLFITLLVVKRFRICGVFVRDAKMGLNGYNFIGGCLTPLSSYINLAIPHLSLMMKDDLLLDDDKSKLQLFINSDIRDVLRYENSRLKNSPNSNGGGGGAASVNVVEGQQQQLQQQPDQTKYYSTAVTMLEGHSMVRKKYYALDIKDDESFKGFLETVDDLFGIVSDED